ncbi:DUF2634 domain-containing protein [Thermotalea metallivorans]|uniref:IraD/Gp25-like domain-containing protein n=1 Tax=Thermotalea metallivorans TaxID=520762 RepID=A0A140LCM0_9FIRM|nr:DUF2634 domain-containing protein [Thermotalea metallivorans]KXG78295.1 hypothetical protein AN619_02700 [Thermotalea metallivorans]
MIPKINYDADSDFEIIKQPTHTYQLNFEKGRVAGYTDGIEAMKQAIHKILFTERYQHEIYSWNYGIELEDLFGKPKSFVYPELKRRITEALLQDDRIIRVDGFSFTSHKGSVVVSFTVHTIFGDVEASREVSI